MKKILFIMNDLECGGAQKALISLLDNINYMKYNVDLLLFNKKGIYLNDLPKDVNILDEPKYFKCFDMSIKKAFIELIKDKKYKLLLYRALSTRLYKKNIIPAVREQRMWKYFSKSFENLENEYDVAIGFLEKTPIYYCIDKVNAKKKIGWIHTNYSDMGMDKEIDKKYFNQLDNIVTVSENSANILRDLFPNNREKIKVIKNIVSDVTINKLANIDVNFTSDYLNIVTVGRLTFAKGYDIAIEAFKYVVDAGVKARWYVVGEGEERENLNNLIKKYNLDNSFILLGEKKNPYPYIKAGDIYCQTSRYEGIGISIIEAKILKKPIIITNFTSSEEQICNGENGLICSKDPREVAKNIIYLSKNKELRLKFQEVLSNEEINYDNSIEEFEKICN